MRGDPVVNLKAETVKPAIGAIVHVDRADILDKSLGPKCIELIERHGVVVFPRVGLSNEEQQAFTENLGASVSFTTNAPGGDKAGAGGYNITLDPKINNEPEYVQRSEEHTSALQSPMRNSYAVFCLKKKKNDYTHTTYKHYCTIHHT